MHRVKSEHCKDDDDDDITDDERKGDPMLNHPGAMQSGNFHRGKTKKRLSTLISERNELERSFIHNRYRLLRAHREIVANYSIFKAIEC